MIEQLDPRPDLPPHDPDEEDRAGRKVSRLVLDAEDRLGELLEPLANPTLSRRGKRQLPEGINYKESFYAKEIHRNPKIVEEVFETKINDIPTRHDVLKVIQRNKKESHYAQALFWSLSLGLLALLAVIALLAAWQYLPWRF